EASVLLHRTRLMAVAVPPDARVLVGVAEQPVVARVETLLSEQGCAPIRGARDQIDLALLTRLQGTEHGLLVFERDQPVRGEEIAGHASSREAEMGGRGRTRRWLRGLCSGGLAEAGAACATNAHVRPPLSEVTSRCAANRTPELFSRSSKRSKIRLAWGRAKGVSPVPTVSDLGAYPPIRDHVWWLADFKPRSQM